VSASLHHRNHQSREVLSEDDQPHSQSVTRPDELSDYYERPGAEPLPERGQKRRIWNRGVGLAPQLEEGAGGGVHRGGPSSMGQDILSDAVEYCADGGGP
jgi:hypothetical protein